MTERPYSRGGHSNPTTPVTARPYTTKHSKNMCNLSNGGPPVKQAGKVDKSSVGPLSIEVDQIGNDIKIPELKNFSNSKR